MQQQAGFRRRDFEAVWELLFNMYGCISLPNKNHFIPRIFACTRFPPLHTLASFGLSTCLAFFVFVATPNQKWDAVGPRKCTAEPGSIICDLRIVSGPNHNCSRMKMVNAHTFPACREASRSRGSGVRTTRIPKETFL